MTFLLMTMLLAPFALSLVFIIAVSKGPKP